MDVVRLLYRQNWQNGNSVLHSLKTTLCGSMGAFSYSNLPPEASTLLGAVHLISWFYRQREFRHRSSPLRGILQLCYMRATEFPFRFSGFSPFKGLKHDSVHNKPSHYLFFRACFANIKVKLRQHFALIHLDWMMMHTIYFLFQLRCEAWTSLCPASAASAADVGDVFPILTSDLCT